MLSWITERMLSPLGRWCAVLLLLSLTVVAYYPSLKGGFIQLDDNVMVYQNPGIMKLTGSSLADMWVKPHYGLYHPLVLLSYAVEYRFFGADPFIYRMTNLYLHAANVVLVWVLFILLTRSAPAAFVVAALFAAHPMRLESIAWISERKDTLYALFYLGALIFYLRYRHTRNQVFIALTLVAFFLSLLSKPMAVTLPAVFIVIDYLDERRPGPLGWRLYVPFWMISLIFVFMALVIHYPEAPREKILHAMIRNAPMVLHNIAFYIEKTLYPAGLSILYPAGAVGGNDVKGVVAVLAALFGALALVRIDRRAGWGLVFFLVSIAPVVNILPAGIAPVADRYMYLPSLGLFYAGFVVLQRWCAGAVKLRSLVRWTAFLVCGGAILASFLATRSRAALWADDFLLLNDAIAVYPESCPQIYNIRGLGYTRRRQYDLASRDFMHAVSLNQTFKEGWNNLCDVFLQQRRYPEALTMARRALEIDPSFPTSWMGAGIAYAGQRQYDRALECFDRIIALDPRHIPALIHRADIHLRKKEHDRALADAEAILGVDPSCAAGYMVKGEVYLRRQDFPRALEYYLEVVKRDKTSGESYCKIGKILIAIDVRNAGKALRYLNQAVRYQPDMAEAYVARGDARVLAGDVALAYADYTTALKLIPKWDEPLRKRILVDFYWGRPALARNDMAALACRGAALESDMKASLREYLARRAMVPGPGFSRTAVRELEGILNGTNRPGRS